MVLVILRPRVPRSNSHGTVDIFIPYSRVGRLHSELQSTFSLSLDEDAKRGHALESQYPCQTCRASSVESVEGRPPPLPQQRFCFSQSSPPEATLSPPPLMLVQLLGGCR